MLTPRNFFKATSLLLITALPVLSACAAPSTPAQGASVNECLKKASSKLDKLQCEFKAMQFETDTQVRVVTIGGQPHEMRSVKLRNPAEAQEQLNTLTKKYFDGKMVRILMPGMMVTKEYREERINFQFNEQGLPERVTTG